MTIHIDYMGGYAGGRKHTVFSFPRPPTTTAKPKKNISGIACVVNLWPGRNLHGVSSAAPRGNPPITTEPEERACVHTPPFRANPLVKGT